MMYSNAQWIDYEGKHSLIRVEINGLLSFVPIDESNTDYRNIMALVAEGKLVIQPA